jgi:hypothetical protein
MSVAIVIIKGVWQLVLLSPTLLSVFFQIQKAMQKHKDEQRLAAIEKLKAANTIEEAKNAIDDIARNP